MFVHRRELRLRLTIPEVAGTARMLTGKDNGLSNTASRFLKSRGLRGQTRHQRPYLPTASRFLKSRGLRGPDSIERTAGRRRLTIPEVAGTARRRVQERRGCGIPASRFLKSRGLRGRDRKSVVEGKRGDLG